MPIAAIHLPALICSVGLRSNSSMALIPAGNWGHRSWYEPYYSSPDDDPRRNRPSAIPRHLRHGRQEEAGVYAPSPWRLFEERVRTGPYGLTRFPSQPQSPVRILVLDGGMEERVNPRLRQFIRDSLPPAVEPDGPHLSNGEFNKAMKTLRKHVYNPPYPRRRAWKRGLFSNWGSAGAMAVNNKVESEEKEEDDKLQCAVCLETFVANEQVLVTPCKHTFHNDCLVPWVKSHGQCPVCRFTFCEKKDTVPTQYNNNNNLNLNGYRNRGDEGEEDFAVDLISLIRAMEEAFQWVALAG